MHARRGRVGARTRRGALRSYLGSAALHGTVLGLGCLGGVGAAVRAADETPRGDPVVVQRAEPARFQEDPREPEVLAEASPPAEALPEPELVPLEPEETPPVWSEERFAPLPEPVPDLRPAVDLRAPEPAPAPAPANASEPAPAPEPAEPAPPPSRPALAALTPPVPLSRPDPTYPRLALRRGEQGSVLCRIYVDARGAVTRVAIEESSGHARLDEAARETLATWRFRPGTIDGVASASVYRHRVRFRLESTR